jgi:hypothetical protein
LVTRTHLNITIIRTAIPVREIDDKISALIILVVLFSWDFKFHFGSCTYVACLVEISTAALLRVLFVLYIALNNVRYIKMKAVVSSKRPAQLTQWRSVVLQTNGILGRNYVALQGSQTRNIL